MTRKELAALEKVFAAEIDDRLPFQSRAKVFQALCDSGHLEVGHRTYGVGERFPVTVSGYVLTHTGRIAYCQSCDDAMLEMRGDG
jgi:hypothetical protein